MILSILIATTSARNEVIKPLLRNLRYQIAKYPDKVELIINDHETDLVGTKRNNLLKMAKGEWVVSIDSDDMVSPHYVSKILQATKTNPDCIGISGIITTNGKDQRQWHISKEYGHWHTKNGKYLRTPNHISPIKRELALQAGFPDTSYGEDAEFSRRVLPLLKSESIVKGNIYHYQYRNDHLK